MPSRGSSATATLAVVNARVLTGAGREPICQAVAVAEGQITAVGSDAEVRTLCGGRTLVLDARGGTVTPGFIDAHTHWGYLGVTHLATMQCPSPPYGSIAEIVAEGRRAAATTPHGQWIVLQGSAMQDGMVAEKRRIEPSDLDGISAEHPVLYKTNVHQLVVNRRALAAAGITEATEAPPGGVIERDAAGQPTGRLSDMFSHLPLPQPSVDELRAALSEVAWERLLSVGVTGIQEITDRRDLLALQRELITSGKVPMRMRFYPWIPEMGSIAEVLEIEGRGADDRHWCEFGGIKLFADGGTASRTAAVHRPYPGTTDVGVLNYDPDELASLVAEVRAAGRQLLLHATGDRGQDEALRAYERAGATGAASLRHRVEHAGNVLWTAARAERFRALKVVPVPNVGFLYDYAEGWPSTMGVEAARGCLPIRTMLDQGFPIAGTSDTTGSSLPALDPLGNIYRAVTRKTRTGKVVEPSEAITVSEAIAMYTRNSAFVGHQSSWAGSIEPGKVADMAILSHDVETLPGDALKDVRVECTIVDGDVVYARRGGLFSGLGRHHVAAKVGS